MSGLVCGGCGRKFDRGNAWEIVAEYNKHCETCEDRKAIVSDQIKIVTHKQLGDGTYLVCNKGDDINQSHWHVANDGTILSIKEGGSYVYNRRQIRKNIRDVTGVNLPLRWSQS